MGKKILITLFVLTTTFAPPTVWADKLTCGEVPGAISKLAAEKDCRHSDDCAIMQLPDPDGCNSLVRAANVTLLSNLLNEYSRECQPFLYKCLRPARGAKCEDGRCVPLSGIGTSSGSNNGALDYNGQPFH